MLNPKIHLAIVCRQFAAHCCVPWLWSTQNTIPDGKVHGANMGPIWGQQDPGGPHVGLMNFVIRDGINYFPSPRSNVHVQLETKPTWCTLVTTRKVILFNNIRCYKAKNIFTGHLWITKGTQCGTWMSPMLLAEKNRRKTAKLLVIVWDAIAVTWRHSNVNWDYFMENSIRELDVIQHN